MDAEQYSKIKHMVDLLLKTAQGANDADSGNAMIALLLAGASLAAAEDMMLPKFIEGATLAWKQMDEIKRHHYKTMN